MINNARHAGTRLLIVPALVIAAGLGACASEAEPETFDTPENAVNALVAALRPPLNRDRLNQILGSEGKEITASGDDVADTENAAEFVANYDNSHRLQQNADGDMELIVGSKDWPMPIPIAKDDKGWFFDTAEGKEEVLRRRVGANENWTLRVLPALVDAQREYAMMDPDNNGLHEYAAKFYSTPGKHDGLYWQTREGEKPSPAGELVAQASGDGYATGATPEPRPFHGYFYRILFEQGRAANGGELEYKANGKLVNGYAIVAWPAKYRNSGVMTFITSHEGIVYQKDLGEGTDAAARGMRKFDPGEGWTPAQKAVETAD
jgi:hypothetical protein